MGTTGAFLSQIEVFIEIDSSVRAGIYAALTAGAFDRIDNNQTIFAAVDSAINFAGIHTGSITAVSAHNGIVSHLNSRNLTANKLIEFQPELADLRLRFGVRSPIIGYMFIFTSNLAVVTTIAICTIMYKYFQLIYLHQ
jgi:hypothetical protein